MKKFISLFLVFSVLSLSVNMFAKERKGADLIIQRTDGTQIRGELIAVKQNSLLLLERESGADVTVDVDDIRVITNVKKWKYRKGLLIGTIVGVGLGAGGYIWWMSLDEGGFEFNEIFVLLSLGIGIAAGALGALISGLSSKDKTIQIEGKSDSEIQDILENLRKKARVRNSQ